MSFDVRKRQVAIIARLSREMSQTVLTCNTSMFANGKSQLLLDRLGRCLKLFVSTDSTSMFANDKSQLLLDRLGRCLKLFVSTDSTSCHEFVSQFGLELCYLIKCKFVGSH